MSPIESYIQRKIVILNPEASARRAAQVMCGQNVGCVLVTDIRGDLVGIVTDRDLACAMAAAPEGVETPLSEIMTPRPVSVEAEGDIELVIRIMEESGVRRIPVVNRPATGGNKCVGIVTLDDLIAAKLIDYDHLTRVVRAQIRRKWVRHFRRSADSAHETRSEAHVGQTLNHFYLLISERVDIPPHLLTHVTQFLLGCLIRRLHYSAAAKFVAQLPRGLQEELLDLPAGPDRTIDPAYLRHELATRFGFSENNARAAVEKFFPTLLELVNPEEMENVMAQLPEELRSLISADSNETHGKTAA